MNTKLTDKNVDKMMTDGVVDADMGIALPGSSKDAMIKEEEHEDVPKVKAMLADLKPTYKILPRLNADLRQFASAHKHIYK